MITQEFVSAAWDNYILLDEPVNDELFERLLLRSVEAGSYVITSASLWCGGQILHHATGSWREYDSMSLLILLGVLGLVIPPIFPSSHWVDRVFDLQRAICVYDDSLWQGRVWLYFNLKLSLRRIGEYAHSRFISFENLQPFVYTPLRPNQIRLLRLRRRHLLSGLLDARLEDVYIDQLQPYEALSYTWGPSERCQGILLNGKKSYVTTNLHALLHARSSPWRGRVLWVDFLCINQGSGQDSDQGDLQEKSVQIGLMKDIYPNASRVIAWLGDPYDASLAILTMYQIIGFISFKMPPLEMFDRLGQEKNRPRWKALTKLLKSDYISRAWICQEIVLAKDLQFYIGGQYIRFDSLAQVVEALGKSETGSLLNQEGVEGKPVDAHARVSWGLMQVLRIPGLQTSLPLGYLLSSFSKLRASWPVDKIFSLLGLADPESIALVNPDYTVPYTEVYTNTSASLLGSPQNAIYLLPHAGIGYRGSTDLPSWVPDWHHESMRWGVLLAWECPDVLYRLGMQNWTGFGHPPGPISRRYGTSGDSVTNFQVCRCVDALYMPGIVVDEVYRVGLEFPKPWEGLPEIKSWLVDALANAIDGSPGVPTADVEERFWRTIIGNRSKRDIAATEEFAAYYNIWKHTIRAGIVLALRINELERLMQDTQDAASTFPETKEPIHLDDGTGEALRKFAVYHMRVVEVCRERRFAVSKSGRFAMVPMGTLKNDLFCVVQGMQTPYVLRLCQDHSGALLDKINQSGPKINPCPHEHLANTKAEGPFRLVGECYVHGVMDGEFMDEHSMGVLKVI
jgi:hypothetical protein